MPRKRHVSRNRATLRLLNCVDVMPRKRHVSRNGITEEYGDLIDVMPRKRHVSRNYKLARNTDFERRHASQEACE